MTRRILVTGAASGLGRAMALRFAADGARVLATDVDADGLAATAAASPGIGTLALDVRDDGAWAAARAWCEREWGGLDLLVNNAGVASGGLLETQSMADWDWILELNLKSVVRGCRTFVPLFKRQGSGQILNVASMAGIALLPSMSSYNVTKAGVVALSRTLRYELRPYGIGVTVLCPAFVRTNLASSMTTSVPSAVAAATRMMENSTLTAEDVAEQALDALRRNRFLVITDRGSRILHLATRLAPSLVERVVAQRWDRMRHRHEQALETATQD